MWVLKHHLAPVGEVLSLLRVGKHLSDGVVQGCTIHLTLIPHTGIAKDLHHTIHCAVLIFVVTGDVVHRGVVDGCKRQVAKLSADRKRALQVQVACCGVVLRGAVVNTCHDISFVYVCSGWYCGVGYPAHRRCMFHPHTSMRMSCLVG